MSDLKIIQIPIPSPQKQSLEARVNVYLVGTEEDSVLIDAGYDTWETADTVEKALKSSGLATPTRIFLTHYHPDHAPGAKRFKAWLPTIYYHKQDALGVREALSIEEHKEHYPLVEIEDNHRFDVGGHELIALHTPGHTAGHLNFYLPEQKILFTGDNILGEGTTWIGPPDGNMRAYLNSLERIYQLDIARIAPGHGKWVDNPHQRIAFVRDHRLEREQQILSIISQQPDKRSTVSFLTQSIYKDTIPHYIYPWAERTVLAHIEKLVEDQKLKPLDDGAYMMV